MDEGAAYPQAMRRIIAYFSRLPGVGRRTGERLGLALMNWRESDVVAFGTELAALRQNIDFCPQCGNYIDAGGKCAICTNPARDKKIICIVEHVAQILVIEKSGSYHGVYHVLGGKISPMSGVGPEDLRVSELHERLLGGSVAELLIALSPDVEGEATSNYIVEEFSRPGLSISRIASGVPVGADLTFADAATIGTAISGRHKLV